MKKLKKKPDGLLKGSISHVMASLSKELVEAKLTEYLQKDLNELELIIKQKRHSAIDIFICRIIESGVKHGDQHKLGFIFDRLIGKVKDVKEIRLPKPTVIERLDGSTVELGSEIDRAIEINPDTGEPL